MDIKNAILTFLKARVIGFSVLSMCAIMYFLWSLYWSDYHTYHDLQEKRKTTDYKWVANDSLQTMEFVYVGDSTEFASGTIQYPMYSFSERVQKFAVSPFVLIGSFLPESDSIVPISSSGFQISSSSVLSSSTQPKVESQRDIIDLPVQAERKKDFVQPVSSSERELLKEDVKSSVEPQVELSAATSSSQVLSQSDTVKFEIETTSITHEEEGVVGDVVDWTGLFVKDIASIFKEEERGNKDIDTGAKIKTLEQVKIIEISSNAEIDSAFLIDTIWAKYRDSVKQIYIQETVDTVEVEEYEIVDSSEFFIDTTNVQGEDSSWWSDFFSWLGDFIKDVASIFIDFEEEEVSDVFIIYDESSMQQDASSCSSIQPSSIEQNEESSITEYTYVEDAIDEEFIGDDTTLKLDTVDHEVKASALVGVETLKINAVDQPRINVTSSVVRQESSIGSSSSSSSTMMSSLVIVELSSMFSSSAESSSESSSSVLSEFDTFEIIDTTSWTTGMNEMIDSLMIEMKSIFTFGKSEINEVYSSAVESKMSSLVSSQQKLSSVLVEAISSEIDVESSAETEAGKLSSFVESTEKNSAQPIDEKPGFIERIITFFKSLWKAVFGPSHDVPPISIEEELARTLLELSSSSEIVEESSEVEKVDPAVKQDLVDTFDVEEFEEITFSSVDMGVISSSMLEASSSSEIVHDIEKSSVESDDGVGSVIVVSDLLDSIDAQKPGIFSKMWFKIKRILTIPDKKEASSSMASNRDGVESSALEVLEKLVELESVEAVAEIEIIEEKAPEIEEKQLETEEVIVDSIEVDVLEKVSLRPNAPIRKKPSIVIVESSSSVIEHDTLYGEVALDEFEPEQTESVFEKAARLINGFFESNEIIEDELDDLFESSPEEMIENEEIVHFESVADVVSSSEVQEEFYSSSESVSVVMVEKIEIEEHSSVQMAYYSSVEKRESSAEETVSVMNARSKKADSLLKFVYSAIKDSVAYWVVADAQLAKERALLMSSQQVRSAKKIRPSSVSTISSSRKVELKALMPQIEKEISSEKRKVVSSEDVVSSMESVPNQIMASSATKKVKMTAVSSSVSEKESSSIVSDLVLDEKDHEADSVLRFVFNSIRDSVQNWVKMDEIDEVDTLQAANEVLNKLTSKVEETHEEAQKDKITDSQLVQAVVLKPITYTIKGMRCKFGVIDNLYAKFDLELTFFDKKLKSEIQESTDNIKAITQNIFYFTSKDKMQLPLIQKKLTRKMRFLYQKDIDVNFKNFETKIKNETSP